MDFSIGEWVSFQHKLGFVLVGDMKKGKCLVQFGLQEEVEMKWIPVEQLSSREKVRLLEEDIGDLQNLAIQLEDAEWYQELESRVYK